MMVFVRVHLLLTLAPVLALVLVLDSAALWVDLLGVWLED